MKGYGIYVKNDLLDPKHVRAMKVSNKTTALWMYLWFLDKVTKITEQQQLGVVLGGKPFKLEEITEDLGIDIKTARKMFHCLIENKYIEVLRTPYGHQVFVTKAHKIFGNNKHVVGFRKSDTEEPNVVGQDSNNVVGLEQNTVGLVPKYGRSNKTIQLDNTSITNVIGDSPVVYGNPDINKLFEYWKEQTGIPISAKTKQNRNACNNLIKKHGVEGVEKLILGVVQAQNDQYAPRIADFIQLQAKLNDLLVWGMKRNKNRSIAI